MPIEIEKRFLIHLGIRELLKKLGATLKKNKTQHDIYYDTRDCILALNDYWLRSRNNVWELKYKSNTLKNIKPNIRTATYYETNDLQEISRNLSCILNVYIKHRLNEMNTNYFSKWIKNECSLIPLADYVVDRESFSIKYKQRTLEIDLDQTNFGCSMMEIEVMAQNENEITECTKDLEEFCKIMFKDMQRKPKPAEYTKIQIYLFQYNRIAHDLIMNSGHFPLMIASKL